MKAADVAPFRFEGGPLDGELIETTGAHIVRVPLPVPVVARWDNRPPGPSLPVGEYRRAGSVYRFETLIDDARAAMGIAAEAFADQAVRRIARGELRREIQALDPGKELGAVVWVVGCDPRLAMFTLAAFVGGRRREHAATHRREIRQPNV